MNAGLSGYITESSCMNIQNNNNTISNECGCTSQYDNTNSSSNVPTPTSLIILIPPTNTGVCYICYNDINATIQYPDILVDTRFLGTGTIVTLSCQQLYQNGLDGLLLIGWCDQIIHNNDIIQQQCGCTNYIDTPTLLSPLAPAPVSTIPAVAPSVIELQTASAPAMTPVAAVASSASSSLSAAVSPSITASIHIIIIPFVFQFTIHFFMNKLLNDVL